MNLVDFSKYQQMLQVLGQQSPMMPQAGGLFGPMMADMGDRRREDQMLAQAPAPSAPWETNIVRDNQYGPDRINDQRHPAPRVEYMEVPTPTEGKPHDWTHVTKEPDGTLRYWNLPKPMSKIEGFGAGGLLGPMMAAKGDVDGEWESYGSLGTRKGGDMFNPADKEGDLDVEGYEKARNEEGNEARGTDHKDPNDAKGWRRQLWIKKQRPMS